MLSVFVGDNGKVHVIYFARNELNTDPDGVTRYVPRDREHDMDWHVYRSDLPKDLLTALCALELCPVGVRTEIEGIGVTAEIGNRQVFILHIPADTDPASLFPLPALKL